MCLCDADGNVSLTSNVRLYQNNDVLDGFICLRHQDRQHNVRVSRRLRLDMDHLGAGPLRIEIVKPMEELRLVLEDNEQDIALDVLCRSTTVPYMDPIEVVRIDGRLMSERATYELTGVVEGWVRVGDARYELTPSSSSFFRNHSWGNQAGRGGPRLGAPSGRRKRVPGVRHWVLFNMESHGGFFFQDPNGREASGKGAILLPDGSVPIVEQEHDIEMYEGGRRLKCGSFRLVDADGQERTLRGGGHGLGLLPGRRLLRRVRRQARAGHLPRRRAHRGRGVGREPPHPDRRRRGDGRSSSTTTGPRASPACAPTARPGWPTTSAW